MTANTIMNNSIFLLLAVSNIAFAVPAYFISCYQGGSFNVLPLNDTPIRIDELLMHKEWRYPGNCFGQNIMSWQLYPDEFSAQSFQYVLQPNLSLPTDKYSQGLMLNINKLRMEYVPSGDGVVVAFGFTMDSDLKL